MSNNPSQTKSQSEIITTKQLDRESTYHVNGKTFVVTPVFRENGMETLGSALLRLIQTELVKC